MPKPNPFEINFRKLSSAQVLAQEMMMAQVPMVEKIERNSNWVNAGAGAAIVVLVANLEKTPYDALPFLRWALVFLVASYLPSILTKFAGYTAEAFDHAKTRMDELLHQLWLHSGKNTDVWIAEVQEALAHQSKNVVRPTKWLTQLIIRPRSGYVLQLPTTTMRLVQ